MSERDIFTAAREQADPAARAAYLDRACAGDRDLRDRVEALLRAHDRPDSLLDVPAVALPDPNATAPRAFGGGATPDDDADTRADEALGFLAPPLRPGSLGRIGHYEVLEVLGRGGFGIVFRAFDEVLQRVVAVKVLAPQVAATSPARKRFLREARSSAQVRHENVVQVHAVEEQPLPYLVMEFIPGETLQQRLDRTGPLDVPEVLRIGRQVAEGLAAAHGQGLIHRDIKPANVLVEGGARQRVKLTDFGLARAADDASISQSGVVAGTPMYMAPEQAKGESLDHRADLFSLGSVLYVMCSGRPPFRASGAMAVLKRVCEEDPRPIREVIAEVPEWLCRVVGKLHAKDPAARFQSAREVADLLADCEAQLKSHTSLKDFSRIPGGKPARWSGRWQWTAAALPLLALVGIGMYAVIGLQHLTPQTAVHFGKIEIKELPPSKANAPPFAVAPFGAEKAKELQDAWARHLGVDVAITNSIGMKLRLIPPGEFMMGTSDEEIEALTADAKKRDLPDWMIEQFKSEAPRRRTLIEQPFYLGGCEVTVADFRNFAEAAKYKTDGEKSGDGGWANFEDKWVRRPEHIWKTPGSWLAAEQQPVVQISWNDARAFCEWLSTKEGLRYVLPAEAQWEFAAPAGTTKLYGASGLAASLDHVAWTRDNLPRNRPRQPQPVGEKAANAFGLYDMLGNAWEWCAEWQPDSDGKHRVLRGGGWHTDAVRVRPANRSGGEPDKAWDAGVGFRVAIVGDPKPKEPPRAAAPAPRPAP